MAITQLPERDLSVKRNADYAPREGEIRVEFKPKSPLYSGQKQFTFGGDSRGAAEFFREATIPGTYILVCGTPKGTQVIRCKTV